MMRQLVLLLSLLPALAFADWQLNNDLSRISFVTTKAGNFAEVHRFHSLTGNVSSEGDVQVQIDLASVDTAISIRDERLRNLLFETELFPRAELNTAVDLAGLEALAAGTLLSSEQEVEVALHGEVQKVLATVLITRVAPDRFLVTSVKPVVVNAAQFKLTAGVEKLREVAGLPAISQSVPVSFQLIFDRR